MFALQQTPIDIMALRNSHADANDGALTSFEGLVRADKENGRTVAALLYVADHRCQTVGEQIMAEAKAMFPITHAVCVQRTGQVNAGETAIWVGAWAGHRDESFKACRYIIEESKKRLLIWKKEIFTDGTSKWIHGAETITLGKI